ncbi:leucyl aminopeptidase family protein [Salisaeta longa]|uniref:leucyl aminopeptidase family protein n=1 Tax=Salisaeta longa TaxID=503170 RepID=UPI0003B483B0|nr:leucyl aminopeptidase [Salisaeta longa]
MTITRSTDAPLAATPDVLIVPLVAAPAPPLVDALTDVLGDGLSAAVRDLKDDAGATRTLYPDALLGGRAVVVSCGPAAEVDAEALRIAAAAGVSAAREAPADTLGLLWPDVDLPTARIAEALATGAVLGGYRFRRYKTDDAPAVPGTLHVFPSDDTDGTAIDRGLRAGRIAAQAACTARDWVNRSPHEKSAPAFSEALQESGATHGYDVAVLDQSAIESEGMGGLLAVNRGSHAPPTFNILTHTPDDAVNRRPIVLVGKGVMFDTGGLSLKPTKDSMDMMKCDMAGAAAVMGTFEALAALEVPLHVIGLIPATDNRPGYNAYVPGDVVHMHDGTTVEVLNTDAEGRLCLADALSYAKRYNPTLAIDLATLTGAAVVALGHEAAALMTAEDDAAAERLFAMQRAGERTGERVHPLPMYDRYGTLLESDVADLKNVGGRAAGSITAGKFLEHFAPSPWLHLDIAGTAFLQQKKDYRPAGGTGFGVRLLVDFLREYVTTHAD